MIQISRLLARQLRSVFRKLGTRSTAGIAKVSFLAQPHGLLVRLHRAEILAEYELAGEFSHNEFIIALQALADFEGRNGDMVTFDTNENGIVQARWEDGGLPQVMGYEAEDPAKLPAFPKLPEVMSPVAPGIFKVVADAAHSTSMENFRYATTNIQLAGSSGTIVATNGRELLQTAFTLPWNEDVLVPSSTVFACKELQHEGPVSIGKTETHVAIQTGSWTLHLPIDSSGRYPNVASVIPKLENSVAHCRMDTADSDFLARALARLPGADEENSPVTVDLNGQVSIRAKAHGQEQLMELILARSESTGKPQRFVMNRNNLARAIALGFVDLHVEPSKPLLFQDEKRKFVVTPLDGASLPPSERAIRIASTKEPEAPTSLRRIQAVNDVRNDDALAGDPQQPSNGKGTKRTRKSKSTGLAALIEEADALKGVLREICSRSHKLVVSLKRHRKQSRLVQHSLKALKELQQIEA